ncbi:branched-chain amino acid ABC transporter permease [Agromyces archimandritae]|uniref:branched-chain amino acid ABC transporter permease n=1 Tax=Agromyces archimandritae TaxID=2781962 RepID=UPI003CC7D0AD
MLLGALLAALTLSGIAASPAVADDGSTASGSEEYDYHFSGIVKLDDKPLEGVAITIDGGGFKETVDTDVEGRWKIGVPEKAKYTLTVDESTLPKGIIVEGDSASQEVEFGLTQTKVVNLFLGEGVRETTSFADQFVERIFNGLNFGLLLALAAIGVSLIFGTTGLTNFAHAEMVTFGAIMALVFGVILNLPLWLAILVALILSGVFGWAMDAGLWRPLRRKGLGLIPLMIVSIGLSLALRYVFQFFIGGKTYQLPGAGAAKIELFGPIKLSVIDMVSMGTSIVVLIAVAIWLTRTRIGKATRAISDNPALAAASGIDVDRVIRIVWILAAVLAGLAGILWAYFRPGVKWDMGMHILLLIFAAVILGGLGTAFGALVGAIIVGLLVEISTLWLPPDIKYVGALVVLIVILMFRPQGILGRRERLG